MSCWNRESRTRAEQASDSEVETLYSQMLNLDKVVGVEYIAIARGVLEMALETPRRRLLGRFHRRAPSPAARRNGAAFKQDGAVLLCAGI